MVRTRGDPDGIVIGVDRVGRVPNEFARAPPGRSSRRRRRRWIDARDCAVAPVGHPDRIGGDGEVNRRCSIPIVLMTSRRSASMRETVPSSALATQTEPCPSRGRRAFGPRARGPRPERCRSITATESGGTGASVCDDARRRCATEGRWTRRPATRAGSWLRMALSRRWSSSSGEPEPRPATADPSGRPQASAWRPLRYSASMSWPRSRSRSG